MQGGVIKFMIGIFGGSFDPIHNGHLRAALETYERLHLERIYFLPCYQHAFSKALTATAKQRLEMVKLAITEQPCFDVDKREIEQAETSYTIKTLKQIAQSFPQKKLALIIGIDTFLELPKWNEWEQLLDYASIVVLHRPGYEITTNSCITTYLLKHQCQNKNIFINQKYNGILLLNIPMLEISSTYIREQIAVGKSPCYLIPTAVNTYIKKKKIYH